MVVVGAGGGTIPRCRREERERRGPLRAEFGGSGVAGGLPGWLWSLPLVAAQTAATRSKPIATPRTSTPQSQRALGAGLTLAVSVGLFAYGGQWLDAQYGTKPWLLLLCVGCGIAGGILHLIKVVAPELWPFGKPPKDGKSSGRPSR